MKIVEIEGLTKDYRQHFWTRKRRVLDNVSFHVNKGEIFGFLGPNGSGKSTTIKILLEIIFPSKGTARLFGQPLGNKETKKKIGFLPENPYFYDYLTSEQFLIFHGMLAGMDYYEIKKKIPAVLDQVGMGGTRAMHLRSFSKGMLQRIGLAQAIIHDPEFVILDEPMTGLDPIGRKEVRDLMLDLKAQGKTVFFSTHILSDVESICDRVAILNRGKLLSCGSLKELISVETEYVDMTWNGCSSELIAFLKQESEIVSILDDQVYLKVLPKAGENSEGFQSRITHLVESGARMNGRLHYLSPKRESLEDIFMKRVGRLESRV